MLIARILRVLGVTATHSQSTKRHRINDRSKQLGGRSHRAIVWYRGIMKEENSCSKRVTIAHSIFQV
jgi:hypothetical protein